MRFLSRISGSFANWYRGTYVPPPKNDPDSLIVIISPGYYEQPLLAKILGAIGRFIAAEWKWLLLFLVALVATIAAVIK